jgi:hypothetical protein
MANDRKSTIEKVIRANPYGNQLEISREIKKRSGMGVAFPALKKLRAAVGAGNFDSVYAQLFSGAKAAPVQKRGPGRPRKIVPHVSAPIHQGEVAPLILQEIKRGPGRPRKNPLPQQTQAKRGPGRPRKDGAPAQGRQPKERGDRRAKIETRGRRKADLNKIQLNDFSGHLVVYRVDGALTQQTFKSRERAEQCVRELLNAGHVATEIAYYRLNPIRTTVTVQL